MLLCFLLHSKDAVDSIGLFSDWKCTLKRYKRRRTIQNFLKNVFNYYVFNTTVSGRYITVFLPEVKNLILCEVMIFGTIKESSFELVKENKTWEDALYYCRDRGMDLASIVDEDTQVWAELEAQKADTPFVWLGLRYTCTLGFWFWVDDQRLEFSRWAPNNKTEKCDMSVAMDRQEDHLWYSKLDDKMFNFICAK
ncbi:C-type lectin lectoxin-Phi1 [Perca flavescens]|uniref:C-type lectin lectoxin-Phi1 n=1 Tax=Perca flavescens TaxID=8167 RepID=UPI00106E9596|nr:C-type lectin lectoxin-Phi1-like [Perca flavescens]